MKKALVFFSLLIFCIIIYIIYDEYTFSPLNKNDLGKLFGENKGAIKKICSKDLLGLSLKGELYDVYLYKVEGFSIDKSFPKLSEWENRALVYETIVSKWKNCPIDSATKSLFHFTLTLENFDKLKCSTFFNKEIQDMNNYYSYIYINELEQYFLLYCTNTSELFYIRRRGF